MGTDTTFYTYDALGNLTQVRQPDRTRIGYLLDAQHRRIDQTVNDTLVRAWLYQGQLTPVAELDGSGTVVSRFVYATGVNVPDYLVRGDSTYRLIRDHLGSVRLVVNVASGTIAQQVTYDEFGIETANTNPGWQPFGYAGGLTDAATGLVRFGARDYDPTAGRWTAKDPIGFAGGDVNLYAYSRSDPLSYADPNGREIALMGHPVLRSPRMHALIRITPDDQARWRSHPLFQQRDAQGRAFMTLGAGPLEGKLVSAPNREYDVGMPHPWRIPLLPRAEVCYDENAIIEALLALDANYSDDIEYSYPWTHERYEYHHEMPRESHERSQPDATRLTGLISRAFFPTLGHDQ